MTVAAILRSQLGLTWTQARVLCERGKVFWNETPLLQPATRLSAGHVVTLRMDAKVPVAPEAKQASEGIIFEDSQVVVINKPEGMSSVPYERDDPGTAMDWIRQAWRAEGRKASEVPLHIVHRIDKDTSGLLLFAKTKMAERALQTLWRNHDIDRRYLCVVHGHLTDRTLQSYFVEDRGDGLRGSLRRDQLENGERGKRAITHVKALEHFGDLATLCSVKIETGKTHQIRIHLSEARHPIVGETVYIRDYIRHGNVPLVSPRLLLHAELLGFVHPATGEKVMLERSPPPDFMRVMEALRRRGQNPQGEAARGALGGTGAKPPVRRIRPLGPQSGESRHASEQEGKKGRGAAEGGRPAPRRAVGATAEGGRVVRPRPADGKTGPRKDASALFGLTAKAPAARSSWRSSAAPSAGARPARSGNVDKDLEGTSVTWQVTGQRADSARPARGSSSPERSGSPAPSWRGRTSRAEAARPGHLMSAGERTAPAKTAWKSAGVKGDAPARFEKGSAERGGSKAPARGGRSGDRPDGKRPQDAETGRGAAPARSGWQPQERGVGTSGDGPQLAWRRALTARAGYPRPPEGEDAGSRSPRPMRGRPKS